MTITITITGDARTVRNELHELIGSSRIYELPEKFRAKAEPAEPSMTLAEAIAADAQPEPVTGEILPPDDKPKRGRKRATEPERQLSGVAAEYQAAMAAEAAPMSAAEAEKVMAADAVGQAPETPPETTLADVQNAIRDVAMRFDTEACKQLLQMFGAGKSSEVKPEDRADFVKAAKEFKR